MGTRKGAGMIAAALLWVLGIGLACVAAGSAAGLTAPSTPDFALGAAPAGLSARQGQSVSFAVIATARGNFRGGVTLTAAGTPAGATATFSPAAIALSTSAPSGAAVLTITTAATTPVGSYAVTVTGATGALRHSVAVGLTVTDPPPGKPFTISGNLRGPLAPGVPPRPLDLTLANPNNQRLAIANLTVTVAGTSAGAACGPANFVVTQYGGAYPLNLAARQTASLSQLGVAASMLPTVGMRDLRTNQDACKGVTITLVYSGT